MAAVKLVIRASEPPPRPDRVNPIAYGVLRFAQLREGRDVWPAPQKTRLGLLD